MKMNEEKIYKRTFIPPQFRPNINAFKLEKNNENINEDIPDVERIFSSCSTTPLVISSRHDSTMNEFIRYYSKKEQNIIHIYLEEINKNWDFYFANGIFTIVFKKNIKIIPKAIYYRACEFSFDTKIGKKIQLLNESLEWVTNFIGQKKENSFNASKPCQQILTLQNIIDNNKNFPIKTPETIIVKSVKIPSKYFNHSIIKSISSIRSIVVDESIYEKWDENNLFSIPIMIQERIDGKDIRIHVLNTECWPIIVVNKKNVDYRYNCTSSDLKEYDAPKELIKFSISISKKENNALIGVDFIFYENNYFCLESNPGPGWNWFDKTFTSGKGTIKECLYQFLIKEVTPQ